MLRRLFESSRNTKRIITILFDICAIGLAYYLAYCLRLGTLHFKFGVNESILLGVTAFLSIAVFIRLGMYRAILRYISLRALFIIAVSVAVSAIILMLGSFFAHVFMPRSVPLIYALILFMLIGTPRLLVRSIVLMLNSRMEDTPTNIVIYGAGRMGHQLEIALHASHYKAVAFIDDNPRLHGTMVGNIKVYSPEKLSGLIKKYPIEKILLALGTASNSRRAQVLKMLEPFAIEVQTVPAVDDLLNGKTRIEQIRDVEIEDLLGRDPVQANPELLDACIKDKVVMVTGAGGSIGSELCRQIIKHEPKKIILFELNEYNLYSIEQKLRADLVKAKYRKAEIICLLGSVQNETRMLMIMNAYQVQTVYHAAAYKHVPIVEHNIVEGVRNNVFGTWACAEAAIKAQVESFVLISTDKAVRPTNIMGASKRMAELVLQGLAQRQSKTRFTMVRFGNVLGSSGSVVPLFRKQIKQGGPLTVTHPEIIRYFMTIPEAALLVIQAGSMGKGGDVFVLDMSDPIKILDLAKRMVHLSGLTIKDKNNPEGDIEIEYTGLRPGEKLFEELLIGENVSGTDHSKIMRAEEVCLTWDETKALLHELELALNTYKCDAIKKLLLDAPTGYSSTENLNDAVWLQKQTAAKLTLVSATIN